MTHPLLYTWRHGGSSLSAAKTQDIAAAFLAGYEERYQSRYGFLRPVIPNHWDTHIVMQRSK